MRRKRAPGPRRLIARLQPTRCTRATMILAPEFIRGIQGATAPQNALISCEGSSWAYALLDPSLNLRKWLSGEVRKWLTGPANAKTEAAVPDPRVKPVAGGRTAESGGAVPAAAAHDPVGATTGARRIASRIRPRPIIPRRIPVPAPLPDITVHIVQAPSVWLLLADRARG